MADDNTLEFKDKEIEKIAETLAKEGKREFGGSFAAAKEALNKTDGDLTTFSNIKPAEGATPNERTVLTESAAPKEPAEPAAPTETAEPAFIIKPLETYEGDIAEAIRSSNATVASINLAKQKQLQDAKKNTPRAEVIEKTEKIAGGGLSLLVSLVLIVATAAIGALIYFFIINRPAPNAPIAPSLITTNEKIGLDISGLSRDAVVDKIRGAEEKQTTGAGLTRIEFTETNSATPNQSEPSAPASQPISPARFFEIFAPSAPATLTRAFGRGWIFGFQKLAENPDAPFMIISIDSYDNAFDGMLRWEEKMAENLRPLFLKSETRIATNEIGISDFQDLIIRSKDTRALRDNFGNTILLYSFLDPKNLVIATNEQTFQEILDRFFAAKIVR